MMVHRVIPAVWRDPQYQAWMASFGSTTQVCSSLLQMLVYLS
jgi:hypothetical protein